VGDIRLTSNKKLFYSCLRFCKGIDSNDKKRNADELFDSHGFKVFNLSAN
jgi:hypothetical protein